MLFSVATITDVDHRRLQPYVNKIGIVAVTGSGDRAHAIAGYFPAVIKEDEFRHAGLIVDQCFDPNKNTALQRLARDMGAYYRSEPHPLYQRERPDSDILVSKR